MRPWAFVLLILCGLGSANLAAAADDMRDFIRYPIGNLNAYP